MSSGYINDIPRDISQTLHPCNMPPPQTTQYVKKYIARPKDKNTRNGNSKHRTCARTTFPQNTGYPLLCQTAVFRQRKEAL